VLLLANPASRRGQSLRERALGTFRRRQVRCDAVLTEYAGHAGELAARLARDYEAVFTLGGDGTAIEVIGALAGTGRPVGILPGGTGNLIARSLGVPLGVVSAVEALLDGDVARIDLGSVTVAGGARRFAFSAGVGLDATMIEQTPFALKRRLGVAAYALTASRAVLRRDRFAVRVEVDGERLERDAVAVMVANFGAVLNDLIRLGPGIRQDDGMLDLCVYSPKTVGDAVRVMWRLLRKDFRSDPCLLYRRGRYFRVETDPPRAAQADGELLGPTPFEVRVEPLAATLLVPARG
jgi:YegS/Rv2252/BmrU family lipid kinase